jgi:hypothetical protein
MINYNDKVFRSVSNSENGDVSEETVFNYQQNSFLVSATYSGGAILFGHLIGLANNDGVMEISYHHVNEDGDIRTGVCLSTPEVLPNGKIRLHERWKWTNGDGTEGESILEEV